MPVCALRRPLTHGAVRPTLGELCPQGPALRFPMPPPWHSSAFSVSLGKSE